MKTAIENVSRIEIRKVSGADDPWDGMTIAVNGRPGLADSDFILKRTDKTFGQKRIPHPTLANSYSANRLGGKGETDFILKLPNLIKVNHTTDIENRISDARRIFQQEYRLRNRLHPEPDVLPKLLSSEGDHFVLTYKQFKGPVFYVARQFAEGRNLRRWAKETYPSSDGEFHGIGDARDWFDIAEALVHSLAELHRERAAHGAISPDTIIVPEELVRQVGQKQLCLQPGVKFRFIDAAESQPVVYFHKDELLQNEGWQAGTLKILPVRSSYDLMENLYRYRSESISGEWVKFELDQGNDYYSATDIFSLGVVLAFLATGEEEIISPFEYVMPLMCGYKGWQVVRGCQTRRRYHVMKAKLLDAFTDAATLRTDKSRFDARAVYLDSLCRAEVILQCVRSRPDRRAQDTRHVLTSLETFRALAVSKSRVADKASSRKDQPAKSQRLEILKGLKEIALDDPGTETLDSLVEDLLGRDMPTQICDLVRHRLSSVLNRIRSLSPAKASAAGQPANPSLRIGGGSRATIVDALLGALSSVSHQEECLALTNAGIWGDENFGPISRISSMIQLLRLREVRVNWIIIVRPKELYLPEVQRILGFRRADELKIEQIAKQTHQTAPMIAPSDLKNPLQEESRMDQGIHASATRVQCWSDNVGYFYASVDEDEYEEIFRTKKSFIGLRPIAESPAGERQQSGQREDLRPLKLLIAPDFSAREGSLAALTFWVDPSRSQDLLKAFYKYRIRARSVAHFDRIL